VCIQESLCFFGGDTGEREVMEILIGNLRPCRGTELADGRIPGDSPGSPCLESLEGCDRMEEFGLGTIGENGSERYGIVLIVSRMKRIRNSGEMENPGEDIGAAHGWLLSLEMLSYG
jgi:hypothetical protein